METLIETRMILAMSICFFAMIWQWPVLLAVKPKSKELGLPDGKPRIMSTYQNGKREPHNTPKK